MRKRCKLSVVLMGLLLTAVPAWECPAADAPAGALIIRGSNAMAGLVDEWAKLFSSQSGSANHGEWRRNYRGFRGPVR